MAIDFESGVGVGAGAEGAEVEQEQDYQRPFENFTPFKS